MVIIDIYEDNPHVSIPLLGIQYITMVGEQALELGRAGFESQLQHSLSIWS